MTTSSTTAFDMEFTEIAEEAWERAGRELRSGYDLKTARRSMNLMTIEWQNRGINMWTIDEGAVTLVEGVTQYDLPADTIDLLEQVIRTNSGNTTTQSDITISRVSVSTYASIPNKLTRGRPIQVWVERLAANRRKSFCARMKGMKKRNTSSKTANDPDSRINKSLRKWNC